MSMYKRVGIASFIMMVSVLLSRVIGLGREMAIAYSGGAGGDVDAYQIAFVIPEILNHLLASGFLSVTFIPIFSEYLAKNDEEEGWRVFSVIFTGFGSLLIILISIAWMLAPQLVGLIAPGFDDPVLKAKAVKMTRIIMPAQFFFFAGGLFMAVQFARERFAIPALAPLIYNIGIIAGGLLLGRRFGMEGFSWGVLGGSFVGNFLIQLWGARKAGLRLRWCFDLRHPDLKRYIYLSLPLMFGLTMSFSTEFFLKYFGAYLPEGSIASLTYGLRIMFVLVGFFGQAVGTASFPYMARLAAEQQLEKMNHLLNRTIRYLAVVMPFSVLVMVLRHEVVLMLFQRGRFDAAATALTSQALLFLMIGTVAFAVQTVAVRAYFAMQDTLFPALFTTAAAVISIPVFWFNMKWMGVNGVALAISASAIFQAWLLYFLWNRRSGSPESSGVYRFYAGMILVSCAIGAVLEPLKRVTSAFIDSSRFSGSLVTAGIISILFTCLLLSIGYFFKIEEINFLVKQAVNRIRRKKTVENMP